MFQRAGSRRFQGQHGGATQQRAQILQVPAARHRDQQILGVQNAQHLLAICIELGVAAVARRTEFGQDRFQIHAFAQAAHMLARTHQIAGDQIR